jgi:putative copper resistance protein D
MILVAVVAFRWLILLPAFAGEPDETWAKLTPLFRKLHILFLGSGIVLLLSGVVLFWAVAAGMSGLPLMESLSKETFGTVFFQTQFGTVCQWRLGFALFLGLAMCWLHRNKWLARRKVSHLEIVAVVLSMALFVSLAWMGHAAAAGSGLRRAADALHLLAATIWPTGLLPFALFLNCLRHADLISHFRPSLGAIRRFSNTSFIIVFVLILTGFINSCFTVGSFTALVTTDYGRLLSLKLFLFLIILGIAALNRYRLVPLLVQSAKNPDGSLFFAALKSLQGFVSTEVSLALLIVMVVAVLGITPPVH